MKILVLNESKEKLSPIKKDNYLLARYGSIYIYIGSEYDENPKAIEPPHVHLKIVKSGKVIGKIWLQKDNRFQFDSYNNSELTPKNARDLLERLNSNDYYFKEAHRLWTKRIGKIKQYYKTEHPKVLFSFIPKNLSRKIISNGFNKDNNFNFVESKDKALNLIDKDFIDDFILIKILFSKLLKDTENNLEFELLPDDIYKLEDNISSQYIQVI